MTGGPAATGVALVVAVEEWFHDHALADVVPEHQLRRLPSRLDVAVGRWIALLRETGVRATFCLDPRAMAVAPHLAGRLAAEGHDVREGLADARLSRVDPEVGAVATGEMLRLRGLPPALPRILLVRSWELDADQPRLQSGAAAVLQRHYEGLTVMAGHVAEAARRWRLHPLTDAGAVSNSGRHSTAPEAAPARRAAPAVAAPGIERTRVAVVVPLFDEAENLDLLLRSLDDLRTAGADRYDFAFVLVDDGSRDATWSRLRSACADRPGFALVQHDRNRGIARAIRTGIEHTDREVVATIDADGTYDPLELLAMLPLLDGADLVTASPYHPRGAVRGVPQWRLFLSRSLSRAYRIVLRRPIHTWTSCCRVARRSRMLALPQVHDGFLGVAESLVRLVKRGGVVVEHPATLTTRLFGVSKMKTLRTIRGHVGLLLGLVSGRVR